MAVTSSNSEQPQLIASTGNRSFPNAPLIENADTDQIVVPDIWPPINSLSSGISLLNVGRRCLKFEFSLPAGHKRKRKKNEDIGTICSSTLHRCSLGKYHHQIFGGSAGAGKLIIIASVPLDVP
ncbi:unnamed protein product [Prunus armeniaca]|uniref:Uncharacterized protein n=1 Tax=Prunus armeniaca TaxID=36596 RepID=A0A6J5WUX1_PRUAR|nr:unnamed protein product [Prunus armeniaca]